MSVNKVILVGNLGKDPEVRHLEGGTTVASFTLATSESYTDRNTGQRVTQTEWHNVVLWRKTAEIAEKFLRKGRQVYIEGKLRTRSWTDREGHTRYTTEVVGETLQMLGSRPDADSATPKASAAVTEQRVQQVASPSAAQKEAQAQTDPQLPQSGPADDDLPF